MVKIRHDMGSWVEGDVEVDGAVLPRRFTAVIEDDGMNVRIGVALIAERWEVTELAFDSAEAPFLDQALAGSFMSNLENWKKLLVLRLQMAPMRDGSGRPVSAPDQMEFKRALDIRQRRRLIDDELLASVAEVYSSAPSKQAKAVEKHFVTSPATASRWIKLARERGFLKARGEA